MLGVARSNPELHVRRRTHVQADLISHQPLEQRGILRGSNAMLDAPRAERIQSATDAVRAGVLAGVRCADESGPAGDGKGRGKRFGWGPCLIVRESKRDHSASR